ncbi:MAG: hypothetical protein OWV35_00010 [Firmicutes bacterium]|nr:hypothetical protein [Bacillota bacterium]
MVTAPDRVLPAPTGTWETDVSVFVQFLEMESDAQWAQARWAYLMAARYGRGTSTRLAGATGLADSTIRGLIAAYKAFPTPASRAQDLSFSHHRVAAMTADPGYWLDQAVAHGWSVADLQEAIREARDGVALTDRALKARTRLERAVARFNAELGPTLGLEAELVFRERRP